MVGLILLQSVPGCFKVQKWRFWIFCWRTTVSLIVRFSTWLFHACKSLGFSSTQLFIPWIFAVHHGTHFLCTHLRLSPIIMIMMIITLWLAFMIMTIITCDFHFRMCLRTYLFLSLLPDKCPCTVIIVILNDSHFTITTKTLSDISQCLQTHFLFSFPLTQLFISLFSPPENNIREALVIKFLFIFFFFWKTYNVNVQSYNLIYFIYLLVIRFTYVQL